MQYPDVSGILLQKQRLVLEWSIQQLPLDQGWGLCPPGVKDCPPIVEVLLCQSQRGRQQFVFLPMLTGPLWHVVLPFDQRSQKTRSSVQRLIPFSALSYGSDKLLNCS